MRSLATVGWLSLDQLGTCWPMPEISRFHGIVIGMFYNEHEPPHLHAYYGGYDAQFEIRSGNRRGDFPAARERFVLAWISLHRAELLANWDRMRAGYPPKKIEPLG